MPRELPRDDRAAGSPGTYVSPRPTSDPNADDNVTRELNAFLRERDATIAYQLTRGGIYPWVPPYF